MIYTPDGRGIRRKVGFCDYPLEIVVTVDTTDNGSLVDLIGSSISYWSETEERMMDRIKSKLKKGQDL